MGVNGRRFEAECATLFRPTLLPLPGGRVTAHWGQGAAQLTIECRGHSRCGHRWHRSRTHCDRVHLDLVAGEPGRGSPFSAATSGAISSTRETSCSEVAASVVNGSSSSEPHHTPPSHSARISTLCRSGKLATRLPLPVSLASLCGVEYRLNRNHSRQHAPPRRAPRLRALYEGSSRRDSRLDHKARHPRRRRHEPRPLRRFGDLTAKRGIAGLASSSKDATIGPKNGARDEASARLCTPIIRNVITTLSCMGECAERARKNS